MTQDPSTTRARDALIFGLAKLAASRDMETGGHLERISAFSTALAEQLQRQGGHPEVTDEWVRELRLAAALHDIGKVGVADSALLKPGPLDEAERLEIERHPQIAADTLLEIYQQMGEDTLIALSVQVALYHHEKWDGSGYPFKFKGDAIPLSARIVAVADVYDALTSERVYKDAMTHERACAIMNDGSGSHFDPAVVDAFNEIVDQFAAIKRDTDDNKPRGLIGLFE
ncbi:MAG: HD-GYP domain-containing protein [Phycisphaeraceae bacterium]